MPRGFSRSETLYPELGKGRMPEFLQDLALMDSARLGTDQALGQGIPVSSVGIVCF